jgi:hypothetical protein
MLVIPTTSAFAATRPYVMRNCFFDVLLMLVLSTTHAENWQLLAAYTKCFKQSIAMLSPNQHYSSTKSAPIP